MRLTVSANLHEIFVRANWSIAEDDGEAGHALEPDQSDFNSSPGISVAGDNRSEAAFDEITMGDRCVWSFENLPDV